MDPQLDEPDLRSYLGVLNRRKWWVAGVAALVFGVAVLVSLVATPKYMARATVQTMGLNDPVAVVTDQERSGPDGNRIAQAELAYLRGTTLRFAAMDAVAEGTDLDPREIALIKAKPIFTTDTNTTSSIIELSLESSDRDRAAQLLGLFAKTYIEQRTADSKTALINSIASMDAEIQSIRADIAKISQPLDAARSAVDQAIAGGNQANIDLKNRELDDKQSELQPAISDRYGEIARLQKDMGTLRFGLGFNDGTGASVVSAARSTETPVSPNLPLNLAIGLVFGLFLGIGVALLRDFFDDSIKTKDMVERIVGVPALGLIPKFDTAESELVAASFPTSTAAEAFRSLRTSVKFLGVDREVRVVQITSPSAAEGKTVVAANLATVFAQAGDRVVLVSGDLRRPRAEELLGVPLTPGLTGVLIGEVSLPQAIRPVDGVPNLSVLPAGYPPPNPSELLSGERARRLIDVLAQTYDRVVLDCPPVLPVTDALVLAGMADTTLLVVSANRTSRRGLDRCVELLQQVSAPLVGVVVSSLSRDATYGSEPYGYGASTPKRRGDRSDAYDRSYDAITGYGSQADTAPMAGSQQSDAPLAASSGQLPAVPGNDRGNWPSDLQGRN